MKSIKFMACAFMALAACASFTSCDDDDDNNEIKGVPQVSDVHFDIWVRASANSSTASLVQNINRLDTDTVIDFKNHGADVTAILDEEIIPKGKYYYQAAPQKLPKFAKYQIINDQVITVAERPFTRNTFKDYRYTHSWLSDNELLIMGSNGNSDEILWTKIKDEGERLTITAEGDLGLANNAEYLAILSDSIPKGAFSTSGLARYRKSDNTVIYAFTNKKDDNGFYVAFVDAATMEVKHVVRETRAETMAGTAYGELLQEKMFMDEKENLYIACNSEMEGAKSYTCQEGRLLRINNKAFEFDKNYIGYNGKEGKLVTTSYIGNDKALVYIQDPKHTGLSNDNKEKEGWGSNYNCYYAILDLKTDALTEVQYNGTHLPYCSGTFSQRLTIVNDKAYIGVNPKESAPEIYIYDIRTGNVTKGASIKEGYSFQRIVYVSNK